MSKKKGGYNRRNHLLKVQEIKAVFKQHFGNGQGVIIEHIYKTYIYPKYKISRTTFFSYLKIDTEKQLAELDKNKTPEEKPKVRQTSILDYCES
jgi:hypothetical protein